MTAQNILFNDGWQFCLCDIGTELSALPGRHWYDVELPHDWLINDTSKLYETGEGWYRRSLPCSAEQLSGRVLLNFDGVYMNSTLFVNGKEVGSWTYGYSAFEHDITDFLHEGENELLLRVSHQSPNTRWYSGAGIFRDVMLKLRPAAYIGTNGVYIHSAPQPEGGWTTEVETDVVGEASDIRMLLEVFDPAGASMGGYGLEAHFDGGHEKFTASFNSTDPELWSVDDPMLYTLKISLYSGSELLDCVNETFGYRTAEFDPDRGFLLNGEPVKLHGVCMHHDLGALGSALNEAALARQLRIMKEMGVNAIRTSHNMPARQLVQLCDEMGLLVDSEAFDMWEKPKTEFDNHRFFTEHAERDVRSWIERDRNHPCIIMWSIGNEINDTIDPHGLDITKRLYEYVLKYDPKGNAAPTIGSNYMGDENAQKCSDVVKLAGYNYSEYLYDEHHAKYPGWVIYGSETASAVRSRGIYRFPAELPLLTGEDCQCSSLDNSVVGWGSSAMKSWRLDRDCPFCCGQFIWTGFDYIGEPTPYNTKNSYFGIVDTAGFPKDIYYFYQSVWLSPEQKKVLHIVPSYWDFIPGQEIDVLIYSNARDVELFLNGKSVGTHVMELETSQDMRAHFKVPFEPGVLRVVGHFADGSECSEVLHTPSDPAAVVLTSDKETLLADGRDIAFVEISTVDVNGIPVGNARNRIRVEVSGAGRLVGLDNGDSTDYDSYKGDNRRLFSGKLLAMIESTLEPGEITVRAYSEGLENAELRLVSENCGEVSGVSVVTENKFPAVCRAYTGEVPARLLLPEVDVNSFDPERRSAEIRAKLLPENCTYDDISWSVVRRNGVESNLAQVEGSGRSAVVTAKGDGEFFVRAMVHNGAEHPQVIADIPFTAEGLGAAVRDAYSFISASTLDSSNVPTNIIEDGALSNFDGRTVMTYSDIDFGKTGSQIISLSVGTCFDMPVEVWEGTPDDGKLICRVDFGNNGHWCGFAGQDFALAERLTGVRTISVVIDSRVIFGGFSFVPIERAYDTNWVGEADSVYGDDYRIDGRRVADIGNNVIINYEGLDFGEGGSEALIISGETGNPMNQIQLRYTPAGGAQKTVLLEFQQDGGREQRFDIPKLSGVNDVSFVFMPGSRFDFDWFRFE
ncbi:glycosyl hydrolase family 2 sugar binding domain protein [Eubacterium sp. CAG:115]|nr:glycosyl hydrolase family 2 sugar binding domain protein [Eubacterium sp. CAG:115]